MDDLTERREVMPLRSMLFTPGNNMRMISKAGTLGADAVILDLEDAVPIAGKETARLFIRDAIPAISAQGASVYVRVNSLSTGFTEEDLEWAVSQDLTGIVLAKTESEDDIAEVDQILSRIETEKGIASGAIRLLPLLESAKGILNASQIANAPRNIGLAFGALDYSIDLGIMLSEGGDEIHLPRSIVALISRAFDKVAIDTPWFDIDDQAGMARDASIARNLGFQGKLLIHPSQIKTANEVFSPTNAEIEYSIKVINAFEEAEMSGLGAVSLEGKMIDTANYRQAKNIVALAEEIAMNIR